MKRIYENILDDMTADDRSQSNELRRATQDSTYVAGEGEPYDKFFVRVRFRLTDVPATPEYNYRFDRVIENVQAVLDANRYVTGYSEIFFTSNDGTWQQNSLGYQGETVREDSLRWLTVLFPNDAQQMKRGLFLNFSFDYDDFRSPLNIAWLLCRLNTAIEKGERDFQTRCRYAGIWFKHSGFGKYNMITIHEEGLMAFMRSAGNVTPTADRNYSGYCQINKLYHLFFDGDCPQVYDKIFDWCQFDIERTLFDMVHTSVYGHSDLVEPIITYEQKQKILYSGKLDFRRFLKSFSKNHMMNDHFFFFMWPIPDQNIMRNDLKSVRMPVYNTIDVSVEPRVTGDRDMLVEYLKKNTVFGQDIRVTEEKGRFAVTITLETIVPEDEVPIDACACFAANVMNDDLPANYYPGGPESRKRLYMRWADYMYDDYLSMIMPAESADIIKKIFVEECISYYN